MYTILAPVLINGIIMEPGLGDGLSKGFLYHLKSSRHDVPEPKAACKAQSISSGHRPASHLCFHLGLLLPRRWAVDNERVFLASAICAKALHHIGDNLEEH